jgi:hypothetical protein
MKSAIVIGGSSGIGRALALKLPIDVTDVQPGFVDTRLAGGTFWMASPQTAARQIAAATRRRKRKEVGLDSTMKTRWS